MQTPLTDKELKVLKLVSTGLPNKEIAWELAITVPTVKTHLRNIFKKLEVHSRTEAALAFLQKRYR